MRFNIIGAGRLGKTLAYALVNAKLAKLNAVYNYHYPNAQRVVAELGTGMAIKTLTELPAADLTFITTPDDVIPKIIDKLAKNPTSIIGSIMVHCSGALSSAALAILKEHGCLTASLHPPKSFSGQLPAPNAFADCPLVVEGDENAVQSLLLLFQPLKAIFIPIKVEQKIVYHAGAVIASNYLISLAASAMKLFREADIAEDSAKHMVITLMQSSLDNLKQTTTAAEALTGPLARGDRNTVQKHLAAIQDPVIKSLYCAAGIATLPLTSSEANRKASLKALLEEYL